MLIDHLKIEFDALNVAKVKNFNIGNWQGGEKFIRGQRVYKTKVEDIHSCGMTACAGGYLAMSTYWKVWGGSVDLQDGAPLLRVEGYGNHGIGIYAEGLDAILEFYGLKIFGARDQDLREVVGLIHGVRRGLTGSVIEDFYDPDTHAIHGSAGDFSYLDITPRMVQEKLALLYFICCVLGVGRHGYQTWDGMKLNADGSRSIFDDVDA